MVEAHKLPILRESFNPNLRLAALFCLAGAIALGLISAYGQSAGAVPPAGVTSQLKAAKKIFVASIRPRSEDGDYFQEQVIETVETWRLYEQVPEGAGADLILEPSFTSSGVRLAVRATSTNNVLWVSSRPVKKAFFPDNQEANFAAAIPGLLDDLRQAAGQAAVASVPQSTPPKVFIANVGAGDDAETFQPGSNYTGGTGQAYDKFYSAMQSSGRYELVTTPAQADLIFELCYVDAWRTTTSKSPVPKDPSPEYTTYDYPQVKLLIWNRTTGAVLRAVTENVKFALRSSTADKNFATSLQALLNDATVALVPSARPQPSQVAASLSRNALNAPVPSQISAARKIFITKPGEGRVYAGEAALDLYDEVQAGLQQWGRYELVAKAADADLILEPSAAGEMLRLTVLDPGTSVVLWAFRREGYFGGSKTKEAVHSASLQLMGTLRRLDARASNAAVPSAVSAVLAAAKRVYVSDVSRDPGIGDREGNEDIYKKVLAVMKAWGKYELAPTVASADLSFEPSIVEQDIHLDIVNPNAGGKVWTFTEPVEGGFLISTRDKNIDLAVADLVDSVRKAATDAGNSPTIAPSTPQSK
jgi:hypothetical protein